MKAKTPKTNNARAFTLQKALKGVNLNQLARDMGLSRSNVGRWRTKSQGIRQEYIAMVSAYLKIQMTGYNKQKEPLFKRLGQ